MLNCNYQCSCCGACQDCKGFRKILDLQRDTGLVLYKHTRHISYETAAPLKESVFILHNTKHTEINPADLVTAFEQHNVSCRRCQHTIKNAQQLLQNFPTLNNYVMSICEHCRKKVQSHLPCHQCEQIVKQFISSISKINEYADANEFSQNIQQGNDTGTLKSGPLSVTVSEMQRNASTELCRAMSGRKVLVSELMNASDEQLVSKQPAAQLEKTNKRDLMFSTDVQNSAYIRRSLSEDSLLPTDLHTHIKTAHSIQDISKERRKPCLYKSQYDKITVRKNIHRMDYDKHDTLVRPSSDDSFITTVTDFNRKYFRRDFGYFFPQDTVQEKKQNHISSEELIHDIQEKLNLDAEKENIKRVELEKRKIEEKQQKQLAKVTKRRLEQEQKRVVEEERSKHLETKKNSNDIKEIAETTKKTDTEDSGKSKERKAETKIFAPVTSKSKLKAKVQQGNERKKAGEKDKNKEKEDQKQSQKLKVSEAKVQEKQMKLKSTKRETEKDEREKDHVTKESDENQIDKGKKQNEKDEKQLREKKETGRRKEDKTAHERDKQSEKDTKLKRDKGEKISNEKENIQSEKGRKVNADKKLKSDSKLFQDKDEGVQNKKQPVVNTEVLVQQTDDVDELELILKAKKEEEDENMVDGEKKKHEIVLPQGKAEGVTQPYLLSPSKMKMHDSKHILKKEALNPVKELDIKEIKVRKSSHDDFILQTVLMKQAPPKRLSEYDTLPLQIIEKHKLHSINHEGCEICAYSDLDLDIASLDRKSKKPKDKTEIIIGQKISRKRPKSPKKEMEKLPLLFGTTFNVKDVPVVAPAVDDASKPVPPPPPQLSSRSKSKLLNKVVDEQAAKGIIHYALSDRTFIENGWTLLPTEKIVRKMNVYRMRPAHPEFDWFEHNKNKGLMQYDTGDKFAEFVDNGRGRLYYRNGRLALNYYDTEEMNAQQRFVIYGTGDIDERGRTLPISVLATFDYLGNGVVFDHAGKIRLKYNQTEGVVLDRSLGPVSHWKWHSLNDPPVLQRVMIDTQMSHKDPDILKLGGPGEDKSKPENEQMLAIEFDNFVKEKTKKLSQKFKPFQIKMKALKINEHFSLRVLDQATVYLIFRDGTTSLKMNLGMLLDHQEIVDTDTAEMGEVSTTVERLPAATDSVAGLQRSVALAQRVERLRAERRRRLRPEPPRCSVDRLTAAVSRPLRPALLTSTCIHTPALGRNDCRCSKTCL